MVVSASAGIGPKGKSRVPEKTNFHQRNLALVSAYLTRSGFPTMCAKMELIMAKASNSVLSILLAITLLLGVKVSLQSARADNCFAVPNPSVPKSQALVSYPTDRQRGGNSRHVHAAAPFVDHDAARPRSSAVTRAASTAHTKPAAPDVTMPPPPQR